MEPAGPGWTRIRLRLDELAWFSADADVYQVIIHAGTQAITQEPAEDAEPAAAPEPDAAPESAAAGETNAAGEPGDVSAETPHAIAPDVSAETPAPPPANEPDQPIGHPAYPGRCHPAAITPSTIIPPHSGERLDLHLAIWTCFTNARIKAQRRQNPEPQAQAQCA